MRRALPILILALSACRSDTPEAALRKAFDACVQAVESGDAADVWERLHPAFAGPEGMDRAQARLFLMGLFRQGKVGVTVLSTSVEVRGRQGHQIAEVLLTSRSQGRVLPDESSRRIFHLRWELHEKAWKLREIREA